MIIGAFVEARSCERFYALAPLVDQDLGKYYRYLLKSESRHFEDYLALALDVAQTSKLKNPKEDIQQRIAHFREVEKNLILSPDDLFRFHSGVPSQAA
jgi:tRNA-(ms[2]io[6]A)-hydroxylase